MRPTGGGPAWRDRSGPEKGCGRWQRKVREVRGLMKRKEQERDDMWRKVGEKKKKREKR